MLPGGWVTLQDVYHCAIDKDLFARKIKQAQTFAADLAETRAVLARSDYLAHRTDLKGLGFEAHPANRDDVIARVDQQVIAFLTTNNIKHRIERTESEAAKEIRLRVEAVAELVFDEDLGRQLTPAAFGRLTHAVVPDDVLTMRHGLLGCCVVCNNQTTVHPMVEYLSRKYGKPFYHCVSTVMSEMLPSASNRVFLTGERDAAGFQRPGVRCVFDAEDFLNVETTLRFLGESLIESRKGRVRIHNDRLYQRPTGGGHIMGTTRMGTSRSTSVVDRDCRVHGYRNLFVAGSSVFPTGGYANPTLTIVALSLRLADTLATAR